MLSHSHTWFSHDACFGVKMEDDSARLIGQKRGSRCHRFQNAALLLDAEVVRDTRDLRHVAHEALGAVRVQVVRDNMPLSHAWVALNGAADVGEKVCLGPRRSGLHHCGSQSAYGRLEAHGIATMALDTQQGNPPAVVIRALRGQLGVA